MSPDFGTDQDRAAVLALNEQLRAAWNDHDAAAFVAPWTDDADHVNIFGEIMQGKAAITAGTTHIFATVMSESHSEVVVRGLRFPAPDVAILDVDQTQTGVKMPPGAPPMPPGGTLSRIKIIAVRIGGSWLVESFQNTTVVRRPVPAN